MRRMLIPAALVALAVVAVSVWSDDAVASDEGGPVIEHVRVVDGEVSLAWADVNPDRTVTIEGRGFFGTAFGPFVRFETPDGAVHEALGVVLEDEGTVVAWPPRDLRGGVTVVVENPDRVTASAVTTL